MPESRGRRAAQGTNAVGNIVMAAHPVRGIGLF